MRSLASRQLFTVGAIVALTLVVVLIAANGTLQVFADDGTSPPVGATPPAATPPSLDSGPQAQLEPREQSPWLASGPVFEDKILHWSSSSYVFVPTSTDPANGETVVGEFWVHTDSDGTIIRSHERFTWPEGQLLQELVYIDGVATAVTTEGSTIDGPQTCVVDAASLPPSGMLPPFAAAPATLVEAGFAPGDIRERQLPVTPSFPGATPIQTYTAEDVQGWERSERLATGEILRRWIEVDRFGRIISGGGVLKNVSGITHEETRQSFGPLHVYDPAPIFDTAFVMSEQAQEICHG